MYILCLLLNTVFLKSFFSFFFAGFLEVYIYIYNMIFTFNCLACFTM